ncbi:hypothetical protein [Clostridium butyricum]|nr:hypothetical protein [Clostridium butyricum]MBZ5747894.1 hypothetical protein [Clostridium butyricum]BBK78780.1 hypothetical protein Cbu04g_37880 [Clostridium butyricum]GEQ24996.1 hypothetical protein CBU03nite_14190 [Clostridium butyricum]
MAAFWAVAGINAAFSSLGGESTITASEEKKFSTVDKLKSYGYRILGGISKFSTGFKQSMNWIGEHLLDYDRPNGEGGKSYRQSAQEEDARDEASYNELREKAPCKTAFEDSSNASETTLDLASLAMGVYGVKQLVSSGTNYLRMNKSYINANISEAAQNSNILKQAINNVSKNSKGITLGSNGGNAGKYVSDVKGEFDALKNIKNGTKVAGSAKAGVSGSIDELVKDCEGVSNSNKLLATEGDVGTYKYLRNRGKIGDNITPHHMPSKEYMKQQGVKMNDGVSINMEQPSPGTGGRHRLTQTYGRNMTDIKKQTYYDLSSRDALSFDIKDLRRIYKEQGLYTPEVRKGLMDAIKLNKELYPELFNK